MTSAGGSGRTASPPPEDRLVAALLRLEEEVPAAPDEVRQRVREGAREDWARSVRRLWLLRLGGALAAGLAVLVAMAMVTEPPPPPRLRFGELIEARGPVHRQPADAVGGVVVRASTGAALLTGDELRTPPGGAAVVALDSGHALRIAGDARVVLRSPRRLALEGGRIYVDSGEPSAGGLVVETPLGDITNLGTQFEVGLESGALELRVRSGRVRWEGDGRRETATAGEGLRVSPDGRVERRATPPYGPSWGWLDELATAPDFDEWALDEVLDWFCRETGYRLVWEDPERRAAEGRLISGSTRGLSPEQALDAVLQLMGLDHRLTADGRLVLVAPRQG